MCVGDILLAPMVDWFMQFLGEAFSGEEVEKLARPYISLFLASSQRNSLADSVEEPASS